ncbi:MAG: hypothetical protein ACTSYB_10310 [Candidatus Helarchaeota archaeon]
MVKCSYCERDAEFKCSMCKRDICAVHQTSLGGKVLCTRCIKKIIIPILATLLGIIIFAIWALHL